MGTGTHAVLRHSTRDRRGHNLLHHKILSSLLSNDSPDSLDMSVLVELNLYL